MSREEVVAKSLEKKFSEGVTKKYEWRLLQLKQLYKMFEENESIIGDALNRDLGKPPFESYMAEISLTKAACQLAIKKLKTWMAPEKVSPTLSTYPSTSEIVPEPLGVVLIISTWNYPFLLSIDPMIGAIAAGNVMVLKPSEVAPASAALLAKLIPQYLDNSAIRVFEGGVTETTNLLEQKWDKIFYTGSGRVGKIVLAAAAKHLTPVTLELGGKSPVIIDSKVDLEVTARRIVFGKWGTNCGQACISPDYVITLRSFAPKLISALTSTIEQFYGKDPSQSEGLARIVNFSHFTRLTRLLDDPNVADKIVYGGQRDEKKLRISPTILLDVPMNSMIMEEEIFGPLLPIITVNSREEAFEIVNMRPKPLAAYIFSEDKKFQKQGVENITAGGMVINDTTVHLANHNLPFGGVGDSGIGSYHGKFSFDTFSHKKAVLYRGFDHDFKFRYPPYTPKKKLIVRCLLSGDFFGLLLVFLGLRR